MKQDSDPAPKEPDYPLYVGKYDYDRRADDDLSFKKGDLMYILHTDDQGWMLARSKETGKEGYIPSNYVAEWESLEAEKWFSGYLYVGKYDYDRRADDDLGFKKGDLMYILHTNDEDWWMAHSKETGKEGFIPSNYVAKWKTLEAEEWFFGSIRRVEAERLLRLPPNQYGSFLVRESDTCTGDYNLTVMDREILRSYRIKKLDNGTFFVTRQVTFDTIHDLIHYYEQQADGLCCVLRHTCLSREKPQTAGLSKKANMECELNRDQIRLVGKLGAGTHGEVWEGLWNATTAVAIKTLKPGTSPPTEEIRHLLKLRHPKLVQVYGACTKEEPVYIVMELMKQGSLLEYLKGEGRSLKLPELIDMAAQVAAGMAYLEEQNCTHCNLAARNILIGGHNICKVADFGMARITGEEHMGEHSIKWTAPEALLHKRFTIKSDVWSMGVVLSEIITIGCTPYPRMTNAQLLEDIQLGYRMPRPMGCPDKLYDMMLDCWREEPSGRPTFVTLQWQLEEFFNPDLENSLFGIFVSVGSL